MNWRLKQARGALLLPTLLGAYLLIGAVPASASAPAWSLEAPSEPTVLTQAGNAAGTNQYLITLTNRGAAPTDGSPVKIVDHLPEGFTVDPAGAFGEGVHAGTAHADDGSEVTCGTSLPVTCTFTGSLPPEGTINIFVGVTVPFGAPASVLNSVNVSGGGAAPASTTTPTALGEGHPGFGLQRFDAWASDEDGQPVTQAGSHPYEVSASFNLNTHPGGEAQWLSEEGAVKDVRVDLPPGLVGDPTAVPQCTQQQFHTLRTGEPLQGDACPEDTAIGIARLNFEGESGTYYPVYDLEPQPGVAASFGLTVVGVPVTLNASVRTGGDYAVQIDTSNISQFLPLTGGYITFWGVPGDPSHDHLRGVCAVEEDPPPGGCPSGLPKPLTPLLTMPTACTGPQTTTASADPWASPDRWSTLSSLSHDNAGNPLGLDGCGRVDFTPEISVAPDGSAASTPTGVSVDIHVPQERLLVATSLAQANVKDTTVTLPAGVALNPAAADGLQACSTGQVGFEGQEQGAGTLLFSAAEASCPDASKVATVEIETPLLANKLIGAAYLATQNENPFGSLIALYIIAKDPVSGVLVKLAGQVTPDPLSGQLVSTFKNTPQLPFSDLRLNFFGTARAPLSTPASCGVYTTTASITPWSGNEPAQPSSTFQISTGPGGTPCPSSPPFTPSFTGGTTNLQAGAFSPLVTTIGREDGQQDIQALQLHMPPGLLGAISGVKPCGEAEGDAGTCGEESLIGHTIVSVGLGGDPYTVTGGRVYLTGPYKGAPFGLSIVNPAVAGPFNLGNVIVRAKIEVDPRTAALTITTDDSGPYKIPSILDGIPLQIKHVNVTIDRPGFTFNPTNCNPQGITGSVSSVEGASSPIAVPFQITNCAALTFKPTFLASTQARASRSNGSSLTFKIGYPKNAMGAQAWFNEAKFEIPKQLPARLSTIQQACLAVTFEKDRGACPKHSIIGHALVHTPVLPVPLEGPVYFVSYGGAKFPDAVVVLDGDNVHVELHGNTFINGKTGVTSATFKALPDVPFESIQVSLPTGAYSEFGANLPSKAKDSFCGQKLTMPTFFKAQNGLEIKQNTKLAVTGCPKAKKASKSHARKASKKGKGKK